MSAIFSVVSMILQAIFPALIERLDDTAEEGTANFVLRARLKAKIQRTWGSAMAVLICGLSCLLGGCFTRTVYVPAGEPVRLRETVKDAKIWAVDKNGKTVPGRMDLKEGWYALDANPDAK